MDPLADEPHNVPLSPYHYVWNNPIRFIDPDGRMAEPFTDYYDTKGKFIGTDGVDNGVNVVVTSRSEARGIKKSDGTVDPSSVSSGVALPSVASLAESVNVLDRTIDNGGLREEASIVMNDGTVVRQETGELPVIKDGVQTATTSVPTLPAGSTDSDVNAMIHSHPTTIQQQDGLMFPQSALSPSGQDISAFGRFSNNVIVGPLRSSPTHLNAPVGAAFYKGANNRPAVSLTRKALTRVINRQK